MSDMRELMITFSEVIECVVGSHSRGKTLEYVCEHIKKSDYFNFCSSGITKGVREYFIEMSCLMEDVLADGQNENELLLKADQSIKLAEKSLYFLQINDEQFRRVLDRIIKINLQISSFCNSFYREGIEFLDAGKISNFQHDLIESSNIFYQTKNEHNKLVNDVLKYTCDAFVYLHEFHNIKMHENAYLLEY